MGNKIERKIISDERNRYAREIHDELAQNLTALGLNLQFCINLIDNKPEKAKEVIINCQKLINQSSQELKYTIFEPAALSNLGLIFSINKQIENYKDMLRCKVSVNGKEKIPSSKQELLIWRIFSELLEILSESSKEELLIQNLSQVEKTVNLDISFDFSAENPFVLFNIYGWDYDNYLKSKQSPKKSLVNLFKNAEENNYEIFITQKNNITNIKINL